MKNVSTGELIFLSVVVAAVIFCFAVIYSGFSFIGSDATFYSVLGKNLLEGRGFTINGIPHTIFSPFLPFAIAGFLAVFGDLYFAAHLATAFFALISFPLLYFFVRHLTSKRTAVLATLFFALNGTFIWISIVMPNAEIPAMFFGVLIALALFELSYLKDFSKKGFVWSAILGLAIGIAYITRPEYFFFIFPVLFYLYFIYRKIFSPKKIAIMLLIVFAGFFIISAPYINFLHKNLNQWTFSGRLSGQLLEQSGVDVYKVEDTSSKITSDAVAPPQIKESALKYSLKNLYPLTKQYFDSFLNMERSFMRLWGFFGIMLLGIGLLEFILKKRFKELAIFFISILPIFFIAFAVDKRYINHLVQIFFILDILMAVGFWVAYDKIVSVFNLGKKKAAALLIIASGFMIFYLFFPALQNYLFLPKDYNEKEFRIMGLWMKQNIPNMENEMVITRKPDTIFYSGGLFQIFPDVATFDDLFALMKANNTKYIIADDRYFASSRPQFADLLDPQKAPKELKLVKNFNYYDKKIFIYQLIALP